MIIHLFSKLYRNIVLRDRRAGGYSFCNPRESYFIPRGEAPRDEIWLPRVCKNIASQSAITQWYCYISLLNKNYQTSTKQIAKDCILSWFHGNFRQIDRNSFAVLFSVTLTIFFVLPRVCKSFALPRERKTFVDHFDFQFDGKFENVTKNVYLL